MTKWKLTQALCGDPEIDQWDESEEDLALGYSLLHLLAAEPDNGITELEPGVYRVTSSRVPRPGAKWS